MIAVVTALLAGSAAFTAGDAAASGDSSSVPMVQNIAGTTSLTGIACGGSTCLAVGNSSRAAVVMTVTKGVPAAPRSIPGGVAGLQMTGVACGSPGHCLAVGTTGKQTAYVVPVDHGTPRRPVRVVGAKSLLAVACPSAHRCVTGGSASRAIAVTVAITVTHGASRAKPGRVQTPGNSPRPGKGSTSLAALACPSSHTCYGVTYSDSGKAGALVPIVDGRVHAAKQDVGNDYAIACPSTHRCYSAGEGLRVITDGVPSRNAKPFTFPMNTVACSSPSSCAVEGPGGTGVPIVDGRRGPMQKVTGVLLTRSMSCPSAAVCYAVGDGPVSGLLISLSPARASTVADRRIAPGADARFTTTVTGAPAPKVQWQVSTDGGRSFADIRGAGKASYTVPDAGVHDSGNRYRAVVTNAAGVRITDPAMLMVGKAAAITSEASAAFTIGTPADFTLTSAGTPVPKLAESTKLPRGLTFTPCPANGSPDCAKGTAQLAGTPAAGTAGHYRLTVTAANAAGPVASQAFTLTIGKAGSRMTLHRHGTGAALTLVATVSSDTGKPSGRVRFYDRGRMLGSAPLVGDPTATFHVSGLAPGRHRLTAAYAGDAMFASSSSGSPVSVAVAAPRPSAPRPPVHPVTPRALGNTGVHTSGLFGGAALLMLTGGLALWLGRTRRWPVPRG